MAEQAVTDGISTIVATPHQSAGQAANQADAIRTRTARLRESLRQRGIPLHVLPGAEVRVEPEVPAAVRRGRLLTLADRRQHVLLELPHEIYLPLDRLLYELHAGGMVGILAHPERNLGILRQRQVVAPLVNAGCLLQVTAGSLIGAFGPQVQSFAEWLLEQRLVHFVGTDAHSPTSRRPSLRRAFDSVARRAGEETAADLFCRNPALVVVGKAVVPQPRRRKATGLAGWFRRKRAG